MLKPPSLGVFKKNHPKVFSKSCEKFVNESPAPRRPSEKVMSAFATSSRWEDALALLLSVFPLLPGDGNKHGQNSLIVDHALREINEFNEK